MRTLTTTVNRSKQLPSTSRANDRFEAKAVNQRPMDRVGRPGRAIAQAIRNRIISLWRSSVPVPSHYRGYLPSSWRSFTSGRPALRSCRCHTFRCRPPALKWWSRTTIMVTPMARSSATAQTTDSSRSTTPRTTVTTLLRCCRSSSFTPSPHCHPGSRPRSGRSFPLHSSPLNARPRRDEFPLNPAGTA